MENNTSLPQLIQKINASGLSRLRADIGPIDAKKRTAQLAFSTQEAVVPRFFGDEILGHAPGEVRLDRLNDGAPLLMDHNTSDQIGIVENARIDADGVGRALVRFSSSTRGNEIFKDVQDGIRKNVSVGYLVHSLRLQESSDGDDTYYVDDWEPYEISLVSVPADPNAGIGRGLSGNSVEPPSRKGENAPAVHPEAQQTNGEQKNIMDPNKPNHEPEHKPDPTPNDPPPPSSPSPSPAPQARSYTEAEMRSFLDKENQRVSSILDAARSYGAEDLGNEFARNPQGTLSGLQAAILKRQKAAPPVPVNNNEIGMSKRDLGNYSLMRMLQYKMSGDAKSKDAAGFEREVSQEAAKHQEARHMDGFIVPIDVLRHGIPGGTRDMNTGSNGQTGPGSTGGATVANNLLASSYIEELRNKAVWAKGTTILTGLRGTQDIPKQSGVTQAYWVGEGADVQDSNMDFTTFKLNPKTLGARSIITRRMLNQSSLDIEGLLRADMGRSMALQIDYAGYYGTGEDNQPLGLINQPGINGVRFSSSMPTYQELVAMETQIAQANADVDGMRYKANPAFRGFAKSNLAFPDIGSATIWEPGNTVNGYACDISNQITSGHVFMGNWRDAILAMWGGLEVVVDPYSKSPSGSVAIQFFQDIDVAVRRPQSFSFGCPAAATQKAA